MANTKLSALPDASLNDTDHIYINDGGTSAKATIAQLRAALNPKGFIMLDIAALRAVATDDIDVDANHGGILTNDTTPELRRTSTSTDKSLLIEWIAANVDEVTWGNVPMPPDLNEAVDVTIHLLAKMNAGGDTPTIDVQVFDAIGDVEMGGATAALSSTLAELTVTITNTDISGNPLGFFNISLIPGAHATQLVQLYGAWIEYSRKLAT